MAEDNDRSAGAADAVVVKKYANRRLYNTETSTYVTLEDLAQMVRSDRDFVVRDAKSGDDLTHSVLTQIIVEQESRAGGPTLLPIPFLRQLIRYYDDSVGKMVPSYLQFSMAALAKEQERYRAQFQIWGPSAFEAYQEQARKNLDMFEKAMTMWSPLARGDVGNDGPVANGSDHQSDADSALVAEHIAEQQTNLADLTSQSVAPSNGMRKQVEPPEVSEIDQLKAELAAMQARIERISRSS
ncbi:MAG: polyhydroxyalkanoate synthesis repressor PhaR [Hyphomicrobiaceae bacterium]